MLRNLQKDISACNTSFIMLAKLNIFYITIYFEGGSVNTRSRTMPKKKGADYSANAGLMFLFTLVCFHR
jgi:hypothetical protein